jgi:hypothetical protein
MMTMPSDRLETAPSLAARKQAIIALIAYHRHEMGVNHGIRTPFVSVQVDPVVAMERLGRRVAGEIVADVLVLGHDVAVAVPMTGTSDATVNRNDPRTTIAACRAACYAQEMFSIYDLFL